MSNQQTVAVVVGVSVLLGVGALVADHLSAAQRASLEDVAGNEARPMASGETHAGGFVARALPESWLTAGRAFAETTAVASGSAAVEDQASVGRADESQAGDPVDAIADDPVLTASEREGASGQRDESVEVIAKPLPEPLIIVTGETGRDDGSDDGVGGTIDADAGGSIEHRVARGESLYTIAQRRLGDGNKWRAIAEANPGVVGPKGQVVAGVVLMIPAAGKPVTATGATDVNETILTQAKPAPIVRLVPMPVETIEADAGLTSEPVRTYRVRRGETLSQIAMRELGTVKRQPEILELNSDRIDSPDKIRAGMELRLPSVG